MSRVGHELSSGIYVSEVAVVWFRILNVHFVHRRVGLMKIKKKKKMRKVIHEDKRLMVTMFILSLS